MCCARQGVSRKFSVNAKQAYARFRECASLFSGNIFVNLIVYADESGTHDEKAILPGSEAPVFGGYIADVRRWKLSVMHWQSVLEKYRVPYFHFREFSLAHVRGKGEAS